MTRYVLGLSAYYHDSAAALLRDGELIAAAQEERFTRIKQDSSFPSSATAFCLSHAGIDLTDVEAVYYYEEPRLKFRRLLSTYTTFGLRGFARFAQDIPVWLMDKLHVVRKIHRELSNLARDKAVPPIYCVPHHESHAASAFYASPFSESAVLCIDGVGELATTSCWIGRGNALRPVWSINFPHSLGLLYSAFTYFCGFKVDSGEYKLMGLAPYGQPTYAKLIMDHLIDVKSDGSFWLNMEYFDYAIGKTMITSKFEELFGGLPRRAEETITEREFDLAASIQHVLEETVLKIARSVRTETGQRNLCLAGGVALNCVSNGKILKSGVFDSVWAQPASGDCGGALGAAYAGWFSRMGQPRSQTDHDGMSGAYVGSSYPDDQAAQILDELGAIYETAAMSDLPTIVAQLISQGNVVGWFQGRMEYGPRSLGSRSILGDPRNPDMQSVMNLKIKNRESFRPFAPAVLAEHASDWFEIDGASPYMLFVVPVAEGHRKDVTAEEEGKSGIDKLKVARSSIPAVTHVDFSARVQTVDDRSNPLFYSLISAFHRITGCPVLVNTSFNVRGEPIVESPSDAYRCFMRTAMDYLVIGSHIVRKTSQPAWEEALDWKEEFQLD
ncbi:hypothetical protein A8H39_00635 [Paraburkholderia fungorum]|uniref:carbamoyltransferase family protein n=1 Tax=Paraburkholderia fungorum TaxID=134537 RepID=UPI0004803BAC|nr:carbamoyltransferase [Paraburkholderia fungorum]PNE59973.1 hypothetical protein A8H39_00635 [Paraburkholderia fungorum]